MTINDVNIQDQLLEAVNAAMEEVDEAVGAREGQVVLIPATPEPIQFETEWRSPTMDIGDRKLFAAVMVDRLILTDAGEARQVRYKADDGTIIEEDECKEYDLHDSRRMSVLELQCVALGYKLFLVNHDGQYILHNAFKDGKRSRFLAIPKTISGQQLNADKEQAEQFRAFLEANDHTTPPIHLQDAGTGTTKHRRLPLWHLAPTLPDHVDQSPKNYSKVLQYRTQLGLDVVSLTLNSSRGGDNREPGFIDLLSALQDNFAMDGESQLISRGAKDVASQWEGIEGRNEGMCPSREDHKRDKNKFVGSATGFKWGDRRGGGKKRFVKRAGVPELTILDRQRNEHSFTFIQQRQDTAEDVAARTVAAGSEGFVDPFDAQ